MFDWARQWLFSVFLKKVVKRGIQIVLAFAVANNVQDIGVTLDANLITASVWTGLEALRQWLKVKTEWSWL